MLALKIYYNVYHGERGIYNCYDCKTMHFSALCQWDPGEPSELESLPHVIVDGNNLQLLLLLLLLLIEHNHRILTQSVKIHEFSNFKLFMNNSTIFYALCERCGMCIHSFGVY
jgi:hypothetical protein